MSNANIGATMQNDERDSLDEISEIMPQVILLLCAQLNIKWPFINFAFFQDIQNPPPGIAFLNIERTVRKR